MKLKIHKKTKKRLIWLLMLFLLFAAFQLAKQLFFTHTMMKDSIAYEAECLPSVNYQVTIIPNEVYPGTTQKEDEFYSKKLFHHMQAEFKIDYTGSRVVPVDFEYQILATVIGYQGKEENRKVYWSKVFPVTVKKMKKETNAVHSVQQESAAIPVYPYDVFAAKAKEITGMDLSNEMIVSMKGKTIAHTDGKDLEVPFEVSLHVPLQEDVFQITKSGTDPIKKDISIKTKVNKPLDYYQIIPYSILMIGCFAGLMLMAGFTREPDQDEEKRRKVTAALKNYGSRIAALESLSQRSYSEQYQVHSMKDLIKIADELQKPIFYVSDSNTIVRDDTFFIINDAAIYSLSFDSATD